MEFAQINAILRSPSFPPVDPWYAQGFINYYYYSFYLVAFLIKLTGIPTEYAFNLAQPMVMGVLASATFSVGAMLGARITRGRQSGVLSGLVAVALVSFAGNMMTVGQVADRLRGEEPMLDPFSHWVWNPSRAILDNGAQLITEFPYFTGLYGDLHSHVMGMPLLVLSIALAATFAFDFPRLQELGQRRNIARLAVTTIALGIVYPTNAWDLPVTAGLVAGGIAIGSATQPWLQPRLSSLALIAVPVAVGAFLITLPFVLHFEALFGSVEEVRATTSLPELITHGGGLLLVATVAIVPLLMTAVHPPATRTSMVWFYPLIAIALLGRWLAVDRWPDLVGWLDRSIVLFAGVFWLAVTGDLRDRRIDFDFGLPRWTGAVLGFAGLTAIIAITIDDNPVASLYAAIAIASTCAWLWRRPAGFRFIALMVAGASFIGAGVEVVFLVDDLAGTDWARMNTIFKFYNQVWILLAIAGGSAAGVYISTFLTRLAATGETRSSTRPLGTRPWPAIATVVTGLVLLLASAYPIAATGIRLDARFEPRESGTTLDAYAWMDYGTVQLTDGTVIGFEEDLDVIDWFNEEIEGTPVIAEAAFAPYRCNSSRISIGTGLPSVLGWARHEMQQRHPEVLPQRDADLRTLYTSAEPDEKLAILNRYDVHYIVVGELERSYPVVIGNDCMSMAQAPQYRDQDLNAGIATFDEMVGSSLEVAFQSGDTIVYRVVGNT
jgi:YYY domain-containing protein